MSYRTSGIWIGDEVDEQYRSHLSRCQDDDALTPTITGYKNSQDQTGVDLEPDDKRLKNPKDSFWSVRIESGNSSGDLWDFFLMLEYNVAFLISKT